jgi:hypothetical protein
MLRRKLRPRTDDLKELRVKPTPTWCTSSRHMTKAKVKLSRIRITTSQSKLLPLRRRRKIRRMMVVSCVDLLIIGQRSAQTAKEENLNLSSEYGNLLYVLSVFQSTTWWLDSGANVHVCSDASLFSSYQVARDSSVLMGNGSHASVCGVGTVDLKLTSEKIVQLKNVQHVPSINKNLVSDSLLCKDGFKVVLESNKFIVSKCGQFIGKDYVCRDLFRFSVSDCCNKSVNNICDGINESDASI